MDAFEGPTTGTTVALFLAKRFKAAHTAEFPE